MGMSTHVIGIKPADEKWKLMKAAWDACLAVGIRIPKEVDEFFGGNDPEEQGVVVELEQAGGLTEMSRDGEYSYLVDLSAIPKDVKFIKFTNSW